MASGKEQKKSRKEKKGAPLDESPQPESEARLRRTDRSAGWREDGSGGWVSGRARTGRLAKKRTGEAKKKSKKKKVKRGPGRE